MRIEEVKKKVIQACGNMDPFGDPKTWGMLEQMIPPEMWGYLLDRDGFSKFLRDLPAHFQPQDLLSNDKQVCWERIGNYYKNQSRYHEALSIYFALYDQLLAAQETTGKWLQKATPLVWIGDCFSRLGFPIHAKRYLMLAHVEDSIALNGGVSPSGTGVYFRLVWSKGLPDIEIRRYAKETYDLFRENPENGLFPEWILQQIDKAWMTELPSPNEAGVYIINQRFIQKQLSQLGKGKGKVLEDLADYVLSCMPGCRTTIRKRTPSTEYDIVCSMEGLEVDYRSELGRYFVCECKDWKKPADFTSIAKFCQVLDSTKSRFGVLFSTKGITGQARTDNAQRQRLKVFQNRGVVIVVIDQSDLIEVSHGSNFIALLRGKYERVRLDLS